jgi:hypothetical protein
MLKGKSSAWMKKKIKNQEIIILCYVKHQDHHNQVSAPSFDQLS